jgi:hypothetical protein
MTSAGKSEIGVKPGNVFTSERYQRLARSPLRAIKKSILERPRLPAAVKSATAAARISSAMGPGRSLDVVVRETPGAYLAS